MGEILVGTCSWTDQELVKAGTFYPPSAKTPEERLRYYASVFPVVEVDSTYYAIPVEQTGIQWTQRVPPGFVFDVKAFRLMTLHWTEAKVLPPEERQGLWGELFMMQKVRGYRHWAPFWHSEVTRVFDFSAQSRRLEVKTAAGGQRIHHFTHRQVFAIGDEEIVVASLVLREDDSGVSLKQLIDECRTGLLGTPHFLKLERAVRQTGMEDPTTEGPVFGAAEAERQLAWFRAEYTPHFRLPEPPGVSDTRYRVDLSTAPRLDLDRLNTWLDRWVTRESPVLPVRGAKP